MVRWNLDISEKTDRTLRRYIDRVGGESDDLSAFADEAVRGRLFDLTVNEVKDQNADRDPEQMLDLIDQQLDSVRANRA